MSIRVRTDLVLPLLVAALAVAAVINHNVVIGCIRVTIVGHKRPGNPVPAESDGLDQPKSSALERERASKETRLGVQAVYSKI